MQILPSKYQASLFCNISDLTPETKVIQDLFGKLVEWDVFPSIIKELNLTISTNSASSVQKVPSTIDRIQFISTNRNKRINLLTNRIDIEVFNVSSFDNYELNKFQEDVIKLSAHILTILKKSVNRISLITNYHNPGELGTSNFNDNILINTKIDIEGQLITPSDWNQRLTYKKTIKINDKFEQLNLNAIFGKNILNLQQQIQQQELLKDRIELSFDINTAAEFNTYRFTNKDILVFYNEAYKLNEQLKSNILELFFKK